MRVATVFVLGTIGFYAAIVAMWLVYAQYARPADREGGLGMGVVFVIGPACAIMLGTGTAVLFGGARASQRIKVAAAFVGLLLLIAFVRSLIGLQRSPGKIGRPSGRALRVAVWVQAAPLQLFRRSMTDVR